MKAVGIKVLKNKLSEYVRLAEGGETILITDRDRVVAEIVPAPAEPAALADIRLAELIRKGYLIPAKRPRAGPPPSHPTMKLKDLMKELDEDRADRELP